MGLYFEMRHGSRVERTIGDCYSVFGIPVIAIGSVRSKRRANLVKIFLGYRSAVEIPFSKLYAHDLVRFLNCYSVSKIFWTLSTRSEEHTSELQSLTNIVCRLLLEKKKKTQQ